jgi:hypothetical protein
MNVFDDILAKGIRSGMLPGRTKRARDWYRNTAQQAATKTIQEQQGRTVAVPQIGSMYMFWYNPKHKKTLPFYDRFPLIFPIGPAPGGFYGINFHYLAPRLRARLMDALYQLASDKNYDANTKLRINYQILKNIARIPYYKATVKHYLNTHVKSNFITVFPAEWDIALFLDTQKFEKASAQHVWEVSQNMIQPTSIRPIKAR